MLDILRAVAALEVVLSHAAGLLPAAGAGPISDLLRAAYIAITPYSQLAVQVFFVLSGFVIHLRLARPEGRAEFSILGFARNRALRIYPPLAVAILFTALLDFAGRKLDAAAYASGEIGQVSLKSVAAVVTGFSVPSAGHLGTDSPLWSLSFEIDCYLVYLLLGYLISRRLRNAGPLVIAVCMVVATAETVRAALTGCRTLCGNNFFPYWTLWLAGALLAELHVRVRERAAGESEYSRRTYAAGVVGATILFVIARHLSLLPDSIVGENAMRYVSGTGVAIGLLLLLNPPARLLGTLAAVRARLLPLTACSYSLYIVHAPVLVFGAALANRLAGGHQGWLILIAALVAVAAATTLSYRLAERPITGGQSGWTAHAVARGARLLQVRRMLGPPDLLSRSS